MKQIFKQRYWFLLMALIAVGCTKDFDALNTNPNEPLQVPTAYLLTQAQRGTMAQQAFYTTNLYAQLFAETQYTNTSRYETEQLSFDGFYTGPLADLQEIINLNTDPKTSGIPEVVNFGASDNQVAVARILKAYLFQIITDVWGDVPYFEALKGSTDFLPEYTPQDEIYADLVKELKEASAQIKVSEAPVAGDVIYGGNMGLWRKFANSLLLRVGIRMSEVDPTQAEDVIAWALDPANGGVFESNGESAVFTYLGESINSNPVYYHFHVDNRTDYAISNTLVNFMKPLNDPRLRVYANPTQNSVAAGTPDYVGELYGVSNAIAGGTTNASISFIGDYWKETPNQAIIIMSYSEVLFIQAEVAARGWAGLSDAEGLYEDAITASMNYYGIADNTIISNYLSQEGVAYDQADWRKLIGEQKWISLYAVGHEPWSEWRRLGFPALLRAPNAVQSREIPLRRTYDTREYTLNRDNVNAAVARQAGGGTLAMSTPLWWDK